MHLLTAACRWRQNPFRETDSINHQRVAFPVANGVTCIAGLNVGWMLAHTYMDAAIQVVQAIGDINNLFTLRCSSLPELVYWPVCCPVTNKAGGFAVEPGIVDG